MEAEWKIGDIVVAIYGTIKVAPLDYYSCRGILIKDYKYTIAEITEQTIRVIDIENNYVRHSDALNFDKSDIDNLIQKYDALNNIKGNCNERGWIVFWKNKYINTEELAKLMDIKYENNSFWLVIDDFDDILHKDYEFEINVLSHKSEVDWWSYGDWYDNNIDVYYWKDYNEETLKSIIEYCIKEGIEYEDDVMTEENLILKDGDVYFNDTKLVDILDESELRELKDRLNTAICEAQESADRGEVYDNVKNEFENQIGKFYFKNVKSPKNGKDEEKVFIDLNIDWNEIDNFLKEEYGDYDFATENYGDLLYILKEMEFFKFDVPNYDYISGTIDKPMLNEFTQNRLEW